MKKLSENQLVHINGGGCQKWIRRYNRAVDDRAGTALLEALLYAFEACIDKKYE